MISGERKLHHQTLHLSTCPACAKGFYVRLAAYFPMTEDEAFKIRTEILIESEKIYEQHFTKHADAIGDADLCNDCLEANGGHPRCDSDECICTCTL